MVETGDQDPRLARQPKATDPAELRIRQQIADQMLNTFWAQELFVRTQQVSDNFLQKALQLNGNAGAVRELYKGHLEELNRMFNTQIVEGEEFINEIGGKPVIVVTNHLGTAKAARLTDEQIIKGLDIEPFTTRHFPFDVIAKKLGAEIHEAAVELPDPLNKIQVDSGVIAIPVAGSGRTQVLIDLVSKLIDEETNPLIAMYPEGGTTGKRGGGGIYDLEEFRTGAFVAAKELGIPVLPVCQYFDPEKGMRISIMEPINLATDARAYDEIAESVRTGMQEKLDVLSGN